MTYVMNPSFRSSLHANHDILKEFWIDVIFFDGESDTVTIYAFSEEDAQEQAASMFDNVDYTMVQGCYAF